MKFTRGLLALCLSLASCPGPGPLDAGGGLGGGSAGGAAGGGGSSGGGAAGGAVTDAGLLDAGRCDDFIRELPLDAGLITVDTAAGTSHERARCSVTGAAGREVPFHFTLAGSQLFTAVSTPADGGDATLYLRAGRCGASSDVACSDHAGRDVPEALVRVPLDAGEYFLFVDNFDGFGDGLQFLQVSLQSVPSLPANDGCAGVEALVFDGGAAHASGDTTAAGNSTRADAGTARCSPSAAETGRDVVYSFTIAERSDVALTVTPAIGFEPVVYVTAACGAVDDLGCGIGSMSLWGLPPGTYLVWVDGRNDTSGPFALDLSVVSAPLAPSIDRCTEAPGVLDAGTLQRVLGNTRGNRDDSTSACSFGAGQDVYYRFDTEAVQRFTAVATPAGDAGYRPVLYVLPASSCLADAGVAAAGLAGCSGTAGADQASRLEISALDAGGWLLVVDGQAGTSGPFTLDLELSAPRGAPANDSCGGAALLDVSSGVATATASTRGAANDHLSAACGAGGADVAFWFAAPDGGFDGGTVDVKATVWSNNSVEVSPSLFLESGCDGGVLGCRSYGQGPVTVTALRVPGGAPYVLWVDEASGPGGPVGVQVEIATTAPANDTCAGATFLPLNTSLPGSTLGASSDYRDALLDGGFYFGAPQCLDALPGADVVYRFTTAAAGTYAVRVTPDRGYDPGLAVTRACLPGYCMRATDVGLGGDPELVTVNAGAGETYWVFVDAFSNTAGAARGGFVVSVDALCGGYCLSCVTSAQCSGGQVCTGGHCDRCNATADCPGGKACRVGSCGACTTSAECSAGGFCDAGVCQP